MNLLDIVLLLLVLAYGVSGYWQGFVTGAFATAGLLLGFVGGLLLSLRIFGKPADPSVLVLLGALLTVLACATAGQALLQLVGAGVRDRIRWQPVRALDAVGGAALSMAAVLVIAWALGFLLTGARMPLVTEAVKGSRVLEHVDDVMPERAERALDDLSGVLGSSWFPRYLEPFAREQIQPVGPPPSRIARDPEVLAASRSVVKVRGQSSCGRGVEGSGFLYAPGRVMTNAHVVAGVDEPRVLVEGNEVGAQVVYYDPGVDVAVLAVEGLGLPHLTFEPQARPQEAGAVLGYPEDGPLDLEPARIRDQQQLRSPDIYGSGSVVRDVFSVRSSIRPGNSGGPLVSDDGEVLGVVFAASVTDDSTGYALTAEEVSRAAAQGLVATTRVSSGPCT